MKINRYIINILSLLKDINNENINRCLSIKDHSAHIRTDSAALVDIYEDSICIAGEENVLGKITCGNNKPNEKRTDDNIELFIEAIKDNIVRLNHVGISYSCENINDEVNYYKKIIADNDLKLYEEDSGLPNQRWLFIGNINNWENSLFELVLTESETEICNNWIPHFQIDIDTNLSIEKLEELSSKYIKPNFIDWKLDIENWGVVLSMGKIGNINGINIYLGLGTKLRNTKMHREKILKEI